MADFPRTHSQISAHVTNVRQVCGARVCAFGHFPIVCVCMRVCWHVSVSLSQRREREFSYDRPIFFFFLIFFDFIFTFTLTRTRSPTHSHTFAMLRTETTENNFHRNFHTQSITHTNASIMDTTHSHVRIARTWKAHVRFSYLHRHAGPKSHRRTSAREACSSNVK